MIFKNKRRKKSTYLEYGKNGQLVADNPNSKIQKKAKNVKQNIKFDIKKVFLFIIFCIITFIFLLQVKYMLGFIQLEMQNETSRFTTTSEKIDKSFQLINIKKQKELDLKLETLTLNVETFNQYDHEISSIFFTLKGSISQYYYGKEGMYATQKSYDGVLDRIKLDKDVITANEKINDQTLIRDHYIERLQNIENFIHVNYENSNKEDLVNQINICINKENELKIEGRKSIEAYLNENDIDYEITEEKIIIKTGERENE